MTAEQRKALDPITLAQIERLHRERHVVYVHVRQGLVMVDGFRHYRICVGLAPAAKRLVAS